MTSTLPALQGPPVSGPAQEEGSPLEVLDLLNDARTLFELLVAELAGAGDHGDPDGGERVLDAYLLAAGVDQVVEDRLHRDSHALTAIGRRLRGGPAGVAASAALATASRMLRSGRARADRRLDSWRGEFAPVVGDLAEIVMARGPGTSTPAPYLRGRLASLGPPPGGAGREVLRLPDAFRSFDQHPEDCHRLAERLARQWPDRQRPLMVVGVRTSGSYLAPLQAAALRGQGYQRVDWLTYRPDHPWLDRERSVLVGLLRSGGMAVLVDDPPVTGTKIASAADALEAVGFPRSAVVLLLGLFYHEEHLPARLRQRQVVTLPWPDWSLHDRLGGDGLVKSLTTMLAGRTIPAPGDHGTHKVRTVASAEPVALEPIGDPTARPLVRSHVRALVRAGLVAEDGSAVTLDVYVKGTGLGYFGRHSALVARLLAGSVPDAYGWRDGFLFRRAMPESGRLTRYGAPAEPAGDEQRRHDRSAGSSASCIASYVALRSARAAVPVDTSMRMSHRHTVWELAGDALTATLGRWAPIAGPPARRAARHLLRTSHPSVVDGNAMLAHWFDDDAGLGRKVDFDERAFSVWDQACYDGAWDLAGAAADHRVRVAAGRADDGLADKLRPEYEVAGGEAISPERWYLYQIVHLVSTRHHLARLAAQGPGQLQAHTGSPPPSPDIDEPDFGAEVGSWMSACDRASARVRSRYVYDCLVGGIEADDCGPVCAVSVEDVLESASQPGQLSAAGAVSLRSLRVHGFRLVLVAGGDLTELRLRCHDYGAIGGLGDGGLLYYDSGERRTTTVPDRGDRGASQVIGALASQVRGAPDAMEASSPGALAAVLGHPPGRCGQCRPPRLPWPARLVLGSLDPDAGDGLGRLMRMAPALLRGRLAEGRASCAGRLPLRHGIAQPGEKPPTRPLRARRLA